MQSSSYATLTLSLDCFESYPFRHQNFDNFLDALRHGWMQLYLFIYNKSEMMFLPYQITLYLNQFYWL